MSFVEAIVLGIVQGITEWLPISSSGIVSLLSLQFFGKSLEDALYFSFWLHSGTVLAALVYFWKDILAIFKGIPGFFQKKAKKECVQELRFLFFSTLISGVLGAGFLFFGLDRLNFDGRIAMLAIGLLLVVTGIVQLSVQKNHILKKIRGRDGVLLGVVQVFAALPGLSRSGLTVSTLLFKRYEGEQALKLSFLMGIPVILGAQIVLGFLGKIDFSWFSLVSFVVSFVVGLLSISLLMKLAHRINFGWFCVVLGIVSSLGFFL